MSARLGFFFRRRSLELRGLKLPASTQRLEVQTFDGESLIGMRIRGRASGRPPFLGFGGNAWNAKVTALMLHNLLPDHDVVAFHYRGYAPSSGRPSAQALLSDSLVVFDYLRQALAHEPIVLVGLSIGSGVAAYLARHRPVAVLVLVTPFDSLETLARDLYWWLLWGCCSATGCPRLSSFAAR
jgi:pimeloyl-ACP methyl ester carboxylesterase